MKKKDTNPLKRLTDYCSRKTTRGAKSAVLRMMVNSGQRATWAQVSEWLNPDPEKRRSPRKAKLDALLKIQKQICGK